MKQSPDIPAPHWIQWPIRLLFVLLLVLALAMITFLALISERPRSLAPILPTVEEIISARGAGLKVKIGGGDIYWTSLSSPLIVRLQNIQLQLEAEKNTVLLDEVSIAYEPKDLLLWRFSPDRMVLHRPTMQFVRTGEEGLQIGLGAVAELPESLPGESHPEQAVPPDSEALEDVSPVGTAFSAEDSPQMDSPRAVIQALSNLSQRSRLLRPSVFIIEDASLVYYDRITGASFITPNIYVALRQEAKGVHGVTEIKIPDSHGGSATLRAEIGIDNEQEMIRATLNVDQLSPEALTRVFPDARFWKALMLPLKGRLDIAAGYGGDVRSMNFQLQGKDGQLAMPDWFAAPIPIARFRARGNLGSAGSMAALEEVFIDFNGPTLQLAGDLRAELSREGDAEDAGVRAALEAVVKDLPIRRMADYWPEKLAPELRAWMLTHVQEGVIPEARISFKTRTGEFLSLVHPDTQIEASLTLDDAHFYYNEDYPPVQQARLKAELHGKVLDVALQRGATLEGTRLTGEGHLRMPDIFADQPRMEILLPLAGPVTDVLTYFEHPDYAETVLHEIPREGAEGSFDGTLFLAFPLEESAEGLVAGDTEYRVEARLDKLTLPVLQEAYTLQDGQLQVSSNTQRSEVNGSLTLNGIPMQLQAQFYEDNREFPEQYALQFQAGQELFDMLELPLKQHISGRMDVTATIQSSASEQRIAAKVDLQQAACSFREVGWDKPAGSPASLELRIRQYLQNGRNELRKFSLQSEGMEVAASGYWMEDGQAQPDFEMLLKRVRGSGQNFTGGFRRLGGAWEVRASGRSLNLAGLLDGQETEVADPDLVDVGHWQWLDDLSLDVDFGQVVMGEGRQLNQFSAQLECHSGRCESADIVGRLGEAEPFHFGIQQQDGKRVLQGEAQNAGELLRTLGVFNNLEGGTLLLDGDFRDEEEGHPLHGLLRIMGHRVVKAPVLAKMLSLLSLTGILDTLQGGGVAFDKLRAPFVLSGSRLTLSKAKNVGSAIGITADGKILLAKGRLSLDGLIVPSYTINRFFGKIPMLGRLLVGEDGAGLFSARYSLRGPLNAPEITVNPISILTPGRSRQLFELFDFDEDDG